jgi:hypothetical protein
VTPSAATRRKLDQLHPDLRARVEQLILACPFPLGITSAWRSQAEQQRLYDGWKAGKPGYAPANPPGTSKHENTPEKPAALAADIDYPDDPEQRALTVRWVHRHAADFGLHFPIRREDWHAESNGRPYTPPQEDDVPLTTAEKNEIAELAASKAYAKLHPEIVLVLHGGTGGQIGIDQLKAQLDSLAPKLVTADGVKVCMVTPATGAVHVLSQTELAAWRAVGAVSPKAVPQKISAEQMAALEQAAAGRR